MKKKILCFLSIICGAIIVFKQMVTLSTKINSFFFIHFCQFIFFHSFLSIICCWTMSIACFIKKKKVIASLRVSRPLSAAYVAIAHDQPWLDSPLSNILCFFFFHILMYVRNSIGSDEARWGEADFHSNHVRMSNQCARKRNEILVEAADKLYAVMFKR